MTDWALTTVAFADLVGFTAFAERVTAREAFEHLEAFFDTAVPLVERAGGRVRALLGDGLLASFASPDGALAAGRALVAERWELGVGINSGLVVDGRLGLIGDPVNVASRVQAATRDLGTPLLLTEVTRLLLEDEPPDLVPRGALRLRGKARPVTVFGLADAPVALPGRAATTLRSRWQP